MKILLVTYPYWPPDFGGELLISIERFRSLIQKGHAAEVLTSGKPGYPSNEVSEDGLRISRSPAVGKSRLSRLLRRLIFPIWCLWKMARADFDVLHLSSLGGVIRLHSVANAWLLSLLSRIKNRPVVAVHSLGEKEDQPFVYAGLERLLKNVEYSNTQTIVSVSPALEASVRAVYPKKSRLVVCGIRDDLFRPADREQRALFREQNEVAEDQVVFCFLGSIGRRKGADLLAKAFADLACEHLGWKLWMIGPNNRSQNSNVLEHEVKEVLNLLIQYEDRVRYWGRIDDRNYLSKVLSCSDVFVFPTRKEGFGLAPVEAMACGVPLIISRIPGVTDLANVDGETGLFVEPGSLEDLKNAMRRLGSDAALRSRMGSAACARIKDGFAWANHICEWEEVYRQKGING